MIRPKHSCFTKKINCFRCGIEMLANSATQIYCRNCVKDIEIEKQEILKKRSLERKEKEKAGKYLKKAR